MKRLSSLFLALFSAWLAGSCSSFAYDLTTDQPVSSDVVGTYQLKSQSLTSNGLDDLQGKQPLITFDANGSCSVTDFPVWIDSPDYSIAGWLSFEGQWDISVVGSVRRDGKTYENWGIGCGTEKISVGVGGEFTHAKPPYGIVFIYGDPDSGTAMGFEKSP